MDRYVVSILVNNVAGVLNRVASMFRRRGFNIDTITVGATETEGLSRMTITFPSFEDKQQIMRQLEKMPDVYKVIELERDASVSRELLLIKVKNSSEKRQDILAIVDVFRAKIIDYAPDTITIEVTGESSKMNAIVELLREFGIVEMCRTGVCALGRGTDNVLNASVIE